MTPPASDAGRPRLSDHDLQVLRMMAAGHPMTKIAREVHVSERTLYRQTRRLNRALGAGSRVEALVKAAQLGLLAQD